jgi:hypothetical protein
VSLLKEKRRLLLRGSDNVSLKERLGAGKQADLSKDTTSILSKDMNMGVSLEDRADNVSVTFTMTGAAAK